MAKHIWRSFGVVDFGKNCGRALCAGPKEPVPEGLSHVRWGVWTAVLNSFFRTARCVNVGWCFRKSVFSERIEVFFPAIWIFFLGLGIELWQYLWEEIAVYEYENSIKFWFSVTMCKMLKTSTEPLKCWAVFNTIFFKLILWTSSCFVLSQLEPYIYFKFVIH